MSSSMRMSRPQPDRSGPIRAFFGSPPAPPTGDAGPSSSDAGPRPVGEAVASAVDLGYRVLDEYLRQGQRAAQRFGVRPAKAEAAVDDLQALATRMARYTSDFLGVWGQFVELAFSAGGLAPQPTPRPRPAASPSPARLAITLRITAPRATEVAVDLAADMAERPVTVQDLRSADPTVKPIGGVRLEPATGTTAPCLHVVIPPDQPEGSYVGVVVDDESGRFAGTVSVAVLGANA